MSYCKTSYDTTVGKIFNMSKIELALKEALITGMLGNKKLGVEESDGRVAVFVTGENSESHIPPFIHPYLIQNFKSKDYLVTDVRAFRASTQDYQTDREFELGVKNTVEYALMKSRAALNLMWLSSDVARIRARFSFACSVFAAWLSQSIAKAYALDFNDQVRLMALSVYYYHTLFQTESKLSDQALEVAVVHTIKATKLPAADVYALFEKIEGMPDIDAFCEEAKKVVENVRLHDFNHAMLLTLVKNSWYGTNSKEWLSVALEHPPTWLAIVYATLTERTYKSSSLYKIVEMQGKRGNADEFRLNYQDLIKHAITVVESVDNSELVVLPFE
jgi:hypothetical protein